MYDDKNRPRRSLELLEKLKAFIMEIDELRTLTRFLYLWRFFLARFDFVCSSVGKESAQHLHDNRRDATFDKKTSDPSHSVHSRVERATSHLTQSLNRN
jgi:hypothetical protein